MEYKYYKKKKKCNVKNIKTTYRRPNTNAMFIFV